MSSTKRWKFKNLFTASCGCRPTATDAVVEPKLKPKPSSDQKRGHCAASSASSGPENDGSSPTTFSPNTDNYSPELFGDSLVVAKDSDDPYRDFRQSMVEMIAEKEIHTRSDMQQLLRYLLDLNPPRHHEVILRAFMDIWNGGGDGRTPPCYVRFGHVNIH
ncbi:hypothetical protein C2S51_023763 [Perilla frutescens var. frutescens]|nr:hypothetical protein C2S51_023763 [Perilla frutescens var. frutescens]